MLREVVDDPRAWRAETAGDGSDWYRPLPDEIFDVLQCWLATLPPDQPVTHLILSDEDRLAWSEHLAPAKYDLEFGRGFVILDGLPLASFPSARRSPATGCSGNCWASRSPRTCRARCSMTCATRARIFAAGARFSVTSYESSFHTDNSFGDSILDYVGLLCLKTAKSGGISQNVSGYAVHNALLEEHPDVLADALSAAARRSARRISRGGVADGPPAGDRLGWQRAGRALSAVLDRSRAREGRQAADGRRAAAPSTCSTRSSRGPSCGVEFSLKPGQMYFINNRWILHNRTAFADHPELERRRHLVRLWLRARDEHDRAA